MGIHDRDYMKGRHKGGNSGGGALDEALEGLLGDFFLKHKRLVRLVVAIFLLLLVIGILLAALGFALDRTTGILKVLSSAEQPLREFAPGPHRSNALTPRAGCCGRCGANSFCCWFRSFSVLAFVKLF